MKILSRCQVLSLALLFFPTGRAAAQGAREDYQRAEQFLSGNLRHRICDSRRPGSFCPACPVKPSKETCL